MLNYLKTHISSIIFLLLFGIITFLAFNKQSKTGYFNYNSELWADKSGYYVYLPAAFIYNFNSKSFPDSIDILTGTGFDLSSEVVFTKYTCGVAIMQMPFFLIAHTLAPRFSYARDGFSPIYQKIINLAAVFYLFIGIYFLMKSLNHFFKKHISIITISLLFLGTNLFYYSIDETGMSHVYSFCLFSIFLFLSIKFSIGKDRFPNTSFTLISLIGALIVLIRPTNIIFLTSLLFINTTNLKDVILRFKNLLRLKHFLIALLSSLLIFTPQILYWEHLNGSLLSYSYGNEGFSLWNEPRFLHVWFAPLNGLFTYSPFLLIVIGAMIWMLFKKSTNALFILFMFLAISYICSSWWCWHFGCSLGGRSFVEYYSIFAIPLGFLLTQINSLVLWKKTALFLLFILTVAINIKLTYTYDECFFGTNFWDWNEYFNLLKK